ncbi:MAG: Indole-3-glycerol phosphate synthase [Steroidobacteraceae bacterium]|nr:Indole-3-glycerol phosphate synthase [Steroidobacteraceae bacterium]
MLERRALAAPAPPALALSAHGFDIIAEMKLRSPAVGALATAAREDIAARVQSYATAGAAAVSVLTEPSRFDGSLDHLAQATAALAPARVPAMRKDFLVDPYQVLEARAAGAGGVLVILRMLSRAQNAALIDAAAGLGLFVLLEAFDEADLDLAGELAAGTSARVLVGLNCRDLATLEVVPGRLEALAPRLPRKWPRVAESGLDDVADAARIAAAGYDLALIGSALMKHASPGALLRDMLAAGRGAQGQRHSHA